MKITSRDRAVISQPIHPYLITQIYSTVSLSAPLLCSSFCLRLAAVVEMWREHHAVPAILAGQLWLQKISCESLRVLSPGGLTSVPPKSFKSSG